MRQAPWIIEIKEAYPEALSDLWQYGIDCRSGWEGLIRRAIDGMLAVDPKVKVHVIKEKFGGMQIHVDGGGNDDVRRVIEYYEELSWHVCDCCGGPGEFIEALTATRCGDCRGK